MQLEGKKLFLSGNEAIVVAALDADVKLIVGYPGTPSTEIIENAKSTKQLEAVWSTNEKVAMETAIGVSFAGGRAIACMKHVGLNVAADPLMTLSYTGVKGGLVIISCDDPNMYSSQNEQDNRNYAPFAKIPMIEPSDSQEVYDYFKYAFELSEQYDTPVLFRMVTRLSHSKSLLTRSDKQKSKVSIGFDKGNTKYLMLPSFGRERHRFVEDRTRQLQALTNETPLNVFEPGSNNHTLYVSSSVSYHYLREFYPDVAVLKCAMTYPLPTEKLLELSKQYEEIICVEELDPYLEEHFRAYHSQLAKKIRKRNNSFYCGELSPNRVVRLIEHNEEISISDDGAAAQSGSHQNVEPKHPPAMCSSCPHLTVSNLFRNLGLRVSGDIGCYTLAALPPFNALHSVIDMGASIPVMVGMNKVLPIEERKRTIAVIGDSTFIHSGITGLIEAVFQKSMGVICLLDNSATAMTGRQEHPGVTQTSINARATTNGINYAKLAKVIGVKNIYRVDPYHFKNCEKVLKKAIEDEELSFIIFERACALLTTKREEVAVIDDTCIRCGDCLDIGCPSIQYNATLNRPNIDENSCTGCRICVDICEHDVILLKTAKKLFPQQKDASSSEEKKANKAKKAKHQPMDITQFPSVVINEEITPPSI